MHRTTGLIVGFNAAELPTLYLSKFIHARLPKRLIRSAFRRWQFEAARILR